VLVLKPGPFLPTRSFHSCWLLRKLLLFVPGAGLMLFPDYPKALAECHRVLKPGGLLAVTVWHSLPRIPFMQVLRDFCQGKSAAPALSI
jgi:hypothetical protein